MIRPRSPEARAAIRPSCADQRTVSRIGDSRPAPPVRLPRLSEPSAMPYEPRGGAQLRPAHAPASADTWRRFATAHHTRSVEIRFT